MSFSAVPRPDYKVTVNATDAMNSDIVAAIHQAYPRAAQQMTVFAQGFKGRDNTETAENIWHFLKTRIRYQRDKDNWQLVKLPSRLLAERQADCKSLSLFTAAALKALNMPVCFRYVSYTSSRIPSHVYVTTTDERGNEIIIDSVWNEFNSEKQYKNKKDHCMNVVTLSGTSYDPTKDPLSPQYKMTLSQKSEVKDFIARGIKAGLNHDQIRDNWKKAHPRGFFIWVNQWNDPKSPYYMRTKDELSEQNRYVSAGISAGLSPAQIAANWKASHPDGPYIVFTPTGTENFFELIARAFEPVVDILKVALLAIPRTAFLGIVAVNAFSLATKLKRASQSHESKLKSTWEKLGGSYSALMKAVNSGAKKSPIFGVEGNAIINGNGEGIGTIPHLLATAAPILAVIIPFLESLGIDVPNIIEEAVKAGGDVTPPENYPGSPEPGSEREGDTATGLTISTPLLVGGLIAAFLLLKK